MTPGAGAPHRPSFTSHTRMLANFGESFHYPVKPEGPVNEKPE
jgi:hypothetical protein